MTIWEIKNFIRFRVEKLNELTGEGYKVEYPHGRVLLLKYVNNCPVDGKYGDARHSRRMDEMLAYLDGLLTGLTGIKY